MAKKIKDIIYNEEIEQSDIGYSSSSCSSSFNERELYHNISHALGMTIEAELAKKKKENVGTGLVQSFARYSIDDFVEVKDKMMCTSFIGKIIVSDPSGSRYFVKPNEGSKITSSVWATVVPSGGFMGMQYQIIKKLI